jgi:hypothetical protein
VRVGKSKSKDSALPQSLVNTVAKITQRGNGYITSDSAAKNLLLHKWEKALITYWPLATEG